MSVAEQTYPGPLIEMEDVSIDSLHRPGYCRVEHVNWKVDRGQFWVVAGHHASGKTDLVTTLAGLIAPQQGCYRLLGETMPIFEESRVAARLKVGLTFNGGQLLNGLTVGENISLPLRYHEDLDESGARDRVTELIQALELMPWVDELPGQVGRQWHERAGLARALAMRPELLLLDDPLFGLDARHTSWWLRFLGELARGEHSLLPRPLTVVVTADTLAPWSALATHCAVLENRTLVPMGCLQEPQVREHAAVREYLVHDRWAFDPGR